MLLRNFAAKFLSEGVLYIFFFFNTKNEKGYRMGSYIEFSEHWAILF